MSHLEPAPVHDPLPSKATDLPLRYNASGILDRNLDRDPQKIALRTGEG